MGQFDALPSSQAAASAQEKNAKINNYTTSIREISDPIISKLQAELDDPSKADVETIRSAIHNAGIETGIFMGVGVNDRNLFSGTATKYVLSKLHGTRFDFFTDEEKPSVVTQVMQNLTGDLPLAKDQAVRLERQQEAEAAEAAEAAPSGNSLLTGTGAENSSE